MKLSPAAARARLDRHVHGVLCTTHPQRGPYPQPVLYAVSGNFVGFPIDRVKPKSSSRLQREDNLDSDPRCTLLVEHWDADDWSALWWVRAELRHLHGPADEVVVELADLLAGRVHQYADRPFHRILVCRIGRVTGWSAT